MKKTLPIAMIFLITFSTFSIFAPQAIAEAETSRPSLPDGPAHTNKLVNVIAANSTKVLIVTEGWGPLTGISPIEEKDFWVSVLSEMPGDFDVDWFDGIPTLEKLEDYDLVIYDAGGYWYPLSHVAEPLREYHFSGKPLIVVTPDINYDWQINGEPVPSFSRDVLHIEGVLGIMPEVVYDVYADTGHEIVYGIPKDVGIGVPAVTSWPDCFDPNVDCDDVLRQSFIPETEFGVGTCSGLPSYSPYDPAGKLFAAVAYPGSDTEGRVVTYGFPISGLENINIAKQLATSSIEWALQEELVDIDLTLYIEDAVNALVNKAPGDKIDIVVAVANNEKDAYDINVVFEVPSDLSFDKGFTRADFCDIDEKPVALTVDGNKYTVTISLEGGKSKQVVLRFDISGSALTTVCPVVFARTIVEGVVCSSAITMYNMVDNTEAIIVTNRHLLFKRYGFRERAITWALDWANGSPYPPGGTSYCVADKYEGWCLCFVQDAYQFGADAKIERYGYAKQAANALGPDKNKGVPPQGSFVFYNWYGTIKGVYKNWGHVGLSLGSGQMVHAWTKGPVIASYDKIGLEYIGWAWPPIPPDEVQELLNYLYKISDWREENCIVYYVDHEDGSLKKWDQNVDYTDENTANINASRIDELIENWNDQTNPDYLMIVGGDEIIPFYRLDDSNYYDTADDDPYNSDDPVLHAFDENYFLSDNPYADTSGNNYDVGEIELSIGRIVGYNASEMENFIKAGIQGPKNLDTAVVASWGGRDIDDIIDALNRKNADITDEGTLTENNDWTEAQLRNALRQGFQTFNFLGHADYDNVDAPGTGSLYANELDDVDSNGCFSSNRPLVVLHSCRTGVVTDEDEEKWKPEWDDCMPYALVNRNCSGIVAPGGKAISSTASGVTGYGEQLVNDFMSRLITNDGETLPFGTALRDAKVHYDPGLWPPGWPWGWGGGDRKTVTEYIYFGVPWSTIDPQDSQDLENNSNVSVKVSNPNYASENTYYRIIEVNVTDYSILTVDGYDLIEIGGAQPSSDAHRPTLPSVSIALGLPLDSNVIDLRAVDNVTSMIGEYNIPSIIPAEGVEIGGYEQSAGTGLYPSPIYSIDASMLPDHKALRVKIALVQYNPETRETILFNYTKLRLIYQTAVPITISSFLLDKTEYGSGEAITGLVVVENIASEGLSGLYVNLGLRDCHGKIVASETTGPFDLDCGEIKETSILLDQELPHGTYLLEAEVTGSGTLAASSTYIKILSGGIVDFSAPAEVKSGDDVTFQVSFMNSKSEDVSGESVIYLYDPHDIEIAQLYSSPTTFPANSITQTQITWSTAGKEYGTYTASAMVYAGGESFGPAYHTFTIKPPDENPPTTTIQIGSPNYTTIDTVYVTPSTPFTLTATDNPGGSGVATTWYRIRNTTFTSDWTLYSTPFNLSGLTDGNYTIDFYSIDNAGNIEDPPISTNVTLFSWNYVFEDTYGRETTLKINTAHNFFQFITPDKDYGIRDATCMRVFRRTIIIYHKDTELKLITLAVNTKLDFCITIAWDKQTQKRYFLIDKVGTES